MLFRPLTEKVFLESCLKIPGGVNSPVRAFTSLEMTPLVVAKGKADSITDVDGNEFIDYCMSWGSLILGHANPTVVEKVQKQMQLGSSFGIATLIEKLMAEKISSHIPSIEKIRFVSSGTEATMSALRLARGFTGKTKVIKFNGNYHGHADPFLVQAGSGVSFLSNSSSLGVPKGAIEDTISIPYNDVEAVRSAFIRYKDVAAVIVEPIAANMGLVPATLEFLETLRAETFKAGALLIFDEVVSGFRFGLGGIQNMLGITPDLTCLGKIIGGGLPAAAFGGRKEVMDFLAPIGPVYQAGTLSGNPLALSAGLATLEQLEKPFFYEELSKKTEQLLAPVEDLIRSKKKNIVINRIGSCFTLFFGVNQVSSQEDVKRLDRRMFVQFYQYMFSKGVYFSPAQEEVCFISSAHSEDSIVKTRDILLEYMKL